MISLFAFVVGAVLALLAAFFHISLGQVDLLLLVLGLYGVGFACGGYGPSSPVVLRRN